MSLRPEEMNTVNWDGTAYNGNRNAVIVAIVSIAVVIVVAISMFI